MIPTLADGALAVLRADSAASKIAATARAVAAWRGSDLPLGQATPAARPSRPPRPTLLAPSKMPKRSVGPKGRIALIHALAHIELNAIDLAWDIVARFGDAMPRAFCDEWVTVAEEEARHYAMLAGRLACWGAAYGDLPAHDGLWDAAMRTFDDLAARLVLVPLTLEARGIDVTPQTAQRFRQSGDHATADVLEVIAADEVGHLATGVRWFEWLCERDGFDPAQRYRDILAQRFTGSLKGPFNLAARAKAGMTARYLAPWVHPPA